MEAALGVKSLMARAQRAAQKRGQRPSTAHLLLVMLQEGGDVASLLRDQGVRETDLLNALRVVDPEALNTLDRAMERSRQFAERMGHPGTTPWHLLLAITRDSRSAGHRSLAKMGMGPARLQEEVLSHLTGSDANPEPPARPRLQLKTQIQTKSPSPLQSQAHLKAEVQTKAQDRLAQARPTLRAGRAMVLPPPQAPRRVVGPIRPNVKKGAPRRASARRGTSGASLKHTAAHPIIIDPLTQQALIAQDAPSDGALDPEFFPMLCKLGTDLTARARQGLIDPVIGREAEIGTLLDILGRRRSNNPMLVGPPGVGKTAIVEGLARQLIDEEGPLSERIIIELSAGALVSGTGVRGALSKRITELREEVARTDGRVLLFIDEIHAIVGAEGSGPDDLAHELKSALARGEFPCIGATTEREYRKHFEKDPALARRFSPIAVGEPSSADALKILRGIAPRYAEHHAVRIDDDALEAAVELSVRFLPDTHLPDNAIGVLDLAGARVRRRNGEVLDREAVASVIARRAEVPIERLLMRDGERLLQLEQLLAERVVGHTSEIALISDALRKSAAGFRGRRPLGTFLFLGSTGVGKTEMAKAMADVFFPGSAITRFDMSELSEKHAVARLFGAPPGYVGHEDGGQLTDAIRRRPYQLLLLDEIEKAHPDVLLSLLPLLDEGRLCDSKGRRVDATNTIVVMTSNLGAEASERRSIGFGDDGTDGRRGRALAAVRSAMPPELFNRIDEPLFFAPLSESDVLEIAERMLRGVIASMGAQGVTLRLDPSVPRTLIQLGGYDAQLGARPMRRVIGREVESKLATWLLRGEFSRGDEIELVAGEDAVTFRKL